MDPSIHPRLSLSSLAQQPVSISISPFPHVLQSQVYVCCQASLPFCIQFGLLLPPSPWGQGTYSRVMESTEETASLLWVPVLSPHAVCICIVEKVLRWNIIGKCRISEGCSWAHINWLFPTLPLCCLISCSLYYFHLWHCWKQLNSFGWNFILKRKWWRPEACWIGTGPVE